MPFSLRKLTRLQFIAFGLVVLFGLSTFAFSFRNWIPATAIPKQQEISASQKVEAETTIFIPVEEITLRPTGFYPLKLSRPKGQFLLNVCNRAELTEANFTFVRVVGNGTKEKVINSKVHKSVLDWSSVLDLNPGTYLLTEDTNPKWSCEFTITAK
jgi:hypothetical protein